MKALSIETIKYQMEVLVKSGEGGNSGAKEGQNGGKFG
jgi:hypothetical protein